MAISQDEPVVDTERTEELVGQLFMAGLGAFELLNVYVGDRLGLYRLLDDGRTVSTEELASAAGIHERYAREWLEQQAAAGVLEVDDVAAATTARRYSLPSPHAEALARPDSPFSIAPLARTLVAATQALPKLLEAYRSGGGVEWSAFGEDMIESQGDFNRPWLIGQFGTEILPGIPDVHERLSADPPARVLDVASGVGWSAIALAKAYPKVTVDAFDPDEKAIEIGRALAAEHGVADRVRYEARDGATIGSEGPYDLAVVIEAIHDLAQPVENLAAIREALAPGAPLLVADERVGEEFTAPADEIDRFMYAVSLTVCLPAGMAEEPSAATGTVIRPSTLREYATQAGFTNVEVLPFEPGFLRFYRVT
jgi:2-polyprenyl-3-methyl-5-hydroxy-6-metoxy-1,4-benzoquinol methylase